jgi:hypothetical protein
MMCFPDNSDKLKATSELMLSVFLMDDWIEQQSSREAEQLAEWWAMLWRQRWDSSNVPLDSIYHTKPAFFIRISL